MMSYRAILSLILVFFISACGNGDKAFYFEEPDNNTSYEIKQNPQSEDLDELTKDKVNFDTSIDEVKASEEKDKPKTDDNSQSESELQIRPSLSRFVPLTGYWNQFYAGMLPAPGTNAHQINFLQSAGCNQFPTNYLTHNTLPEFGLCIANPLADQELVGENNNITIEGKIHGAPIADLQVRIQNTSLAESILVKNINELNFSENDGSFHTEVNLSDPGTYIISVSAAKFSEESGSPLELVQNIYIHRVTPPLFSITAPELGTKLNSNNPITIRIEAQNPNSFGIPEASLSINGHAIENLIWTAPNASGEMSTQSFIPSGNNQLSVTLTNQAGSSTQNIHVMNDLKGPEIQFISGCDHHYLKMNENGTPINQSFKFNLQGDSVRIEDIQVEINGRLDPNSTCAALDQEGGRYACYVSFDKPGMNYVAIKVADEFHNTSELTKACALVKDVNQVYRKQIIDGEVKLAYKANFFSQNALQFVMAEDFYSKKLPPKIKNFLNSQKFREMLPKLLSSDIPEIGLFPFSKGNSSIDIVDTEANPLQLGEIDFDLLVDDDKKLVSLKVIINGLKGKMALTTFAVQMIGDTGWPDIDDCGHPYPINWEGHSMVIPSDASKRDYNNICEINFDPEFAGNYCSYNLSNEIDPSQTNRECFANQIKKQKTHLLLNFDRLEIGIPIQFEFSPVAPRTQISIYRPSANAQMITSPSKDFVKADPDYNGAAVFDNDYTQLADIDELFRRSLVDTIARTLPHDINNLLKNNLILEQDFNILNAPIAINLGVDLPNSIIEFLSDSTGKNRVGMSLAFLSSGSEEKMNAYLKSAELNAQNRNLPENVFLDPNDIPFDPEHFGPFALPHKTELNLSNLIDGFNQDFALGINDDGMNQVMFGLVSSGLLDIPFGKKWLIENDLENALPPEITPTVGSLIGSGLRRSDNTEIQSNDNIIMDIHPSRMLSPMIRFLDPNSNILVEESPLRNEDHLGAIIEIGIGQLNLNFFEADKNSGERMHQESREICLSNDINSCTPMVRMQASGLIYAGLKIIDTAEYNASLGEGVEDLADPAEEPLTMVIILDNQTSKIEVSVVPGSNKLSNTDDQNLSQKLQSLIKTALGPSNNSGLSPIAISFSPLLFEKNDLEDLNDDGFKDIIEILGVEKLEFSDLDFSGNEDRGSFGIYTNVLID